MKYIKILLCISTCFYLLQLNGISSSEHRKLIILNDILNEDFNEDRTIYNGKISVPGPLSIVLRNGIDAACSPIIASESLVYYFYKFMQLSNDFFEKSTEELEKKYGKHVTTHTYDTTKNIQKIAIFLMEQFQIMQHIAHKYYQKHKQLFLSSHINDSIQQQQNDISVQLANEILKTLDESNHTIEYGNNLVKKLGISSNAYYIAQLMVTCYQCFNPKYWNVYKTKHHNILFIPMSYKTDASHANFVKSSLDHVNKPLPLNYNDISNIVQKNLEFISDIDTYINDQHTSYEEKKLLDVCIIGHGVMAVENIGYTAGFLIPQFENLLSLFSKSKVFSLFYLTCHGGGMNAKKIWFNSLSNNQTPFLTILSPMTEQPFNIHSPYWTDAFYASTQNENKLLFYFLKKIALSYIPLPDFQEYFTNSEKALNIALDNGLYKPTQLAYFDENNILVSQIALIKFPGVDWFSPYFLQQKVLEITKTRAARSSAEHKKIVQVPNIDIIAFSTPVMYAPLEIHQTKKLRFVSLIPYDVSYQSSPEQISTFIKKIIIGSSIYKTKEEILTNLARENIAPCSIIPLKNSSTKTSILRKNFIIKNIENVDGNLLATDFIISGDGVFYKDGITKKLHYFDLEHGKITTSISKKLYESFKEAFNYLKDIFHTDQNHKTSQSVQQKINIMKKLIDINTEKAKLAQSVSSEEELQEKIQALIKEKIRKNKELETQNEVDYS